MSPRTLPCLLALTLLGGCGPQARVRITRPTTETAWASRSMTSTTNGKVASEQKSGVRVETAGKDTVITWLETGQAFVLKDLSGYWGTLTEDGADIWIGKVRIRINPERLRVECPDARAEVALSANPKEKRLEIRASRGLVSIQPA